jgi:hypothetical protein
LQTSRPAKAVSRIRDEVIDDVVRQLNELYARANLETTLKMGRLIVERFYGGDLTIWRLHRAKEASFRKLAARADRDLFVSATGLYRAVALFELTSRVGVDAISRLTMTHLRAVLGLPEQQQQTLLQAAQQQSWSADQLEREALRVRVSLAHRRGRPAGPPLAKAVRKLVRTWRAVESVMEDREVPGLSDGDLRSLHEAADDLKCRLESFARWLAARRIEGDQGSDRRPPRHLAAVGARILNRSA